MKYPEMSPGKPLTKSQKKEFDFWRKILKKELRFWEDKIIYNLAAKIIASKNIKN